MFVRLALLVALIACVCAACNDDTFCGRRGYAFPCVGNAECPVNVTRFVEYLYKNRSADEVSAVCARYGFTVHPNEANDKVFIGLFNLLAMVSMPVLRNPDTEICVWISAHGAYWAVLWLASFSWIFAASVWQWRKLGASKAAKNADEPTPAEEDKKNK